jgi:hypothetical protein
LKRAKGKRQKAKVRLQTKSLLKWFHLNFCLFPSTFCLYCLSKILENFKNLDLVEPESSGRLRPGALEGGEAALMRALSLRCGGAESESDEA